VLDALPHKRLSAFYFWYYGLLGITHPFWPIYLSQLNYSATEIGLLLSAVMATRIISPNLWGWLADRTGRRMGTIRLGAFCGTVMFSCIFLVSEFWGMLLVIAGYSFFWNAVMPQFEAVTLDSLGDRPEDYSRIRVWGSVGFIVAVVMGGYWFQERIGDFRVAGVFFLAMLWASTFMINSPARSGERKRGPSFGQVLRQWPVMAFLLASFLVQLAHGIYYTFYSLQLEAAGYSRSQVGYFWALSVIAEIVIFLAMRRLLSNWALRDVLVFSLLLTTLRWLLIGLMPGSLSALIFAQCLHAFSFAACHAISMEYLRRFFAGNLRGRGQAIYTSVSFGAGGAAGALIGGLLWDYSGALTFIFAALVSLAAVAIIQFGLDHRRQRSARMRKLLEG